MYVSSSALSCAVELKDGTRVWRAPPFASSKVWVLLQVLKTRVPTARLSYTKKKEGEGGKEGRRGEGGGKEEVSV